MYVNLTFKPKGLEVGISCWYGPVMIWSGERAKIISLVRAIEVSKMFIVVVIVSGFSAWPVLGPEFYLIDVQSVEAVAFVYSDCLGVGEKKNMWMS